MSESDGAGREVSDGCSQPGISNSPTRCPLPKGQIERSDRFDGNLLSNGHRRDMRRCYEARRRRRIGIRIEARAAGGNPYARCRLLNDSIGRDTAAMNPASEYIPLA